MKILLTGASGFLGTHLCQRLLSEGHHIYALVRNSAKFNDIELNERLTLITGNLDDQELGWTALLPSDLDVCVHTAGIVHSYINDHFYHTNARGTAYLVQNLRQRFEGLHFVLISSLAAAGPNMGPEKRNENDLDFPVSIYGRSKKKAEDHLRELAPSGWKISIVRPPMIIGPRDRAVLDIFKMVKGHFVVLPGRNSRKKRYSFVCVFDLVDTITRLIIMSKTGLFYSAHPIPVTFEELIKEIKKQMQTKWILYIPLPLFLVKIMATVLFYFHKFFDHHLRLTPDKIFELAASSWTCEATKSEIELGQTYRYGLQKTIALTLEDYRKRRWL